MSVIANWKWWTYFVAEGEVISRGCIVEYKLDQRLIRFVRFPSVFHIERVYQRLWVDTEKRMGLSTEDFEMLRLGKQPAGFIELIDADPKAYFGGEEQILATYFPERDTDA